MFESKYNTLLTTILIIVVIAIIGLLGFFGYDYYQKYFVTKETSEFVDDFVGEDEGDDDSEKVADNSGNNEDTDNPLDKIEGVETGTNDNNGNGTNITKKTYKGFVVNGTMEIPKTSFKYPVLEEVTTKSIETAVAVLYGAGLNQVGNTVIVGHNYRNGTFFSNNKKLEINDKLYITDYTGKRLTYTIYNKFETTPEDTSFYQRDTDGKAEVTLSTCTDDSSARLIIFARAD